jgi:hypothetical protein
VIRSVLPHSIWTEEQNEGRDNREWLMLKKEPK